MRNTLKFLGLSAAVAAGIALGPMPSNAQINLGVGVDPQVDVRVGDPSAPRPEIHHHYVYEGYESGEWYPERHHRTHQWNARYDGYDCYDAFRYDWEDGHRVRYESTWCYDRRDRPYEARGTRVTVRID